MSDPHTREEVNIMLLMERLKAVQDAQTAMAGQIASLHTAINDMPLFRHTTAQDIAHLRSDMQVTILKSDGIGKSLDALRDQYHDDKLVIQTRMRIVWGLLSVISTIIVAVLIALVKNWLGI